MTVPQLPGSHRQPLCVWLTGTEQAQALYGDLSGNLLVSVAGGSVAVGGPVDQGAPANDPVNGSWWVKIADIVGNPLDSAHPMPVALTPSTAVSSSALETSKVLKASGGTFRSLFAELDATAPSGTYYLQLMTGSASVPADGSVTFLRPPITVIHALGTPDHVTFDEGLAGIAFTVGCSACLSSTRFTKTLVATPYCLFAGSVL